MLFVDEKDGKEGFFRFLCLSAPTVVRFFWGIGGGWTRRGREVVVVRCVFGTGGGGPNFFFHEVELAGRMTRFEGCKERSDSVWFNTVVRSY